MQPDSSTARALLSTLRALRAEPARAAELYPQLYAASFFALVEAGSEGSPEAFSFLTYACADATRELPVFTRREYKLDSMPADAVLIGVPGPVLWPRLLTVVDWASCNVAVDPGQPHGIRLTEPMVLGMVSKYTKSAN